MSVRTREFDLLRFLVIGGMALFVMVCAAAPCLIIIFSESR